VIEIFKDIYSNNFVCVSLNNILTTPILIGRGVLQGDPSSPLLFNMCFNTLMQFLLQPGYRQFGFSYGPRGHRLQRSWLQFADDSVITAPDESSAQGLLNAFQAWTAWAGMTIRLDKCCTFGMKMQGTHYIQSSPALYLREGSIPVIPPGGEFRYLGRRYSIDFQHETIKADLQNKLIRLLSITDKLNIKPQTKIKVLTLYIHSQLLFELKLYNFPLTWIDLNLDASCTKYIRGWLELPTSACVKESGNIRRKEGGLGINTIRHLSQKMQLLKRYTLKSSQSTDINQMWSSSSTVPNNIATDDLLLHHSSVKKSVKALKSNLQQESLSHLLELPSQGAMSKSIISNIKPSDIKAWGKAVDNMAACIFNFSRKALLQILPTTAMLFRWNRSPDPFCTLCSSSIPQTNKHVLSNCGSVAALHRYTIRHNSILEILVQWLISSVTSDFRVYADLPHVNVLPVCDLFRGVRPDVAVAGDNNIFVLELTVCHETNINNSREYKKIKYKNIASLGSTLAGNRVISAHFIEVSTLGFISDCSSISNALSISPLPMPIRNRIIKNALDNSFLIYCNRNNNIIPIA